MSGRGDSAQLLWNRAEKRKKFLVVFGKTFSRIIDENVVVFFLFALLTEVFLVLI